MMHSNRMGYADGLLINFYKVLNPNQARLNVGPDLGPNCLTISLIRKYFFLKKLIFSRVDDKNMKNTQLQELKKMVTFLIAYTYHHSLNVRAQLPSRARGLSFYLTILCVVGAANSSSPMRLENV